MKQQPMVVVCAVASAVPCGRGGKVSCVHVVAGRTLERNSSAAVGTAAGGCSRGGSRSARLFAGGAGGVQAAYRGRASFNATCSYRSRHVGGRSRAEGGESGPAAATNAGGGQHSCHVSAECRCVALCQPVASRISGSSHTLAAIPRRLQPFPHLQPATGSQPGALQGSALRPAGRLVDESGLGPAAERGKHSVVASPSLRRRW